MYKRRWWGGGGGGTTSVLVHYNLYNYNCTSYKKKKGLPFPALLLPPPFPLISPPSPLPPPHPPPEKNITKIIYTGNRIIFIVASSPVWSFLSSVFIRPNLICLIQLVSAQSNPFSTVHSVHPILLFLFPVDLFLVSESSSPLSPV